MVCLLCVVYILSPYSRLIYLIRFCAVEESEFAPQKLMSQEQHSARGAEQITR